MSDTPTAKTTSQIEQEHAELRSLIGSIEHALDAATPEEAAQPIARFTTVLASHFGTEEAAEGFYEQVASRDVRFDVPIHDLRVEHAEMLKQAEHLASLSSAGNWDAARSTFMSLSQTLHAHESKENELMQQAYSEDIGSKD